METRKLNCDVLVIGSGMSIIQPRLFAVFFRDHQHIAAKRGRETLNVVSIPADRLMIWRTFFHLWFRRDYPGTFADWLNHLGASWEVQRIFDRFCQFALSTSIEKLSYCESRAVAEAIICFGMSGVPLGGARKVIRRLSQTALRAGVEIWKTAQVEQLIHDGAKIYGAVIFQRRSGQRKQVFAPVVISAIGPQPSIQLLEQSGLDASGAGAICAIPAPGGLKLQVLSPISLIDHGAIMFCLDTQRVAGVIQITNTDPSLAPPGKHLLISHQILP
jgi:phytoene dehydrogenase-like protein